MNERQDHDQRFKTLIRDMIASFFELFVPEFADRLDCENVVWLENEAFPDPPQGKRRSLDIVGRLPLLDAAITDDEQDERLAIVHIEVESADSVATLRKTMFQYFACLRQKYELPILPIAVYLNVQMDGIGVDCYTEEFDSFSVVRYNYFYVGLPGLDAETYMQPNLLGVALSALMRIDDDARARHKARALKFVAESSESEFRKFLLVDCIETYLTLDERDEAEFQQLINEDEFQEVRNMAITTFDKGVEQGIEQGREQGLEQGLEQGRLEMVLSAIRARFGDVPPELASRLQDWDVAALTRLVLQLPQFADLSEMDFDSIENGE